MHEIRVDPDEMLDFLVSKIRNFRVRERERERKNL
jgi:hypothetical protein